MGWQGQQAALGHRRLEDSVSRGELVWQSYTLAWISKTAVDAYTLRLADAGTNRIKVVKGVWACLSDISSSVNPSAFTVQVVGWTNETVSLRFGCDTPGASARGNYLVWVVGTA